RCRQRSGQPQRTPQLKSPRTPPKPHPDDPLTRTQHEGRSPAMSATTTVRIPTILRTYTGGASEVSAEGGTLSEVIDSLEAKHPGIRARVLDETGKLRRFV